MRLVLLFSLISVAFSAAILHKLNAPAPCEIYRTDSAIVVNVMCGDPLRIERTPTSYGVIREEWTYKDKIVVFEDFEVLTVLNMEE